MAISGSYPTDFQDQQDYLVQVNQTFKNVEAQTSSVTVHSASEPAQSTLKTQWASQIPYLPPSNGGQIQWFDPVAQKVQQVYYPVLGGNNNLYPYKSKPTNIGVVCLGEVVVGAVSNINFVLPQTAKHLLIQFSFRVSGAGTATEAIACRFNSNATASGQWVGYAVSAAANPVVITNSAQPYGHGGFGVQGGMTNLAQASVGQIFVPYYSATVAYGGRIMTTTVAGFPSNTRPYTKTIQRTASIIPAVGALTSVLFFPITNLTFQRGSKIVVWGLM